MRKLLVSLGICATIATACEPYNPQSNSNEPRTQENCSRAVADILGIHWTSEDGATERVSEFNKRVKECMNG